MNERWVVMCSNCDGACLHQEISRLPAEMMTLWSDQYIQGAPGPQWERLARCAHCQAWMWLDQVDTEPWNPTEFTTLPMLAPMMLADWLDALTQGAAEDAEQQFYLYRQIWMQGNHLRREAPSAAFGAIEPPWRAALNNLLPNLADPRLKIELLRELGHFEAALAACQGADLDPEWLAAQTARCEAQDNRPFVVRQVPVPQV